MDNLQINFEYMESQSTEPQSFPSLLRPDYSPQQNPLASALYSQRDCNDRIMGEILELLQKNRGLAKRIGELKKTIPGFLSKWWESSVGAADIPIMINTVENTLVQQLEVMNAAIRQARANRQTEEVQLDKQQQEEQQLLKEKENLENELARETQKNNINQQELNNILLDRKNFLNLIKDLQGYKIFLQLEKSTLSIESNKIKTSFPNDSEEEAMRKYFGQMKSLLIHLIDRREQLKNVVVQADGELDKTNAQIERYEHESRVNQVRKENIVSQHVELKRLKQQLTYREECRRKAERKKAQLESAYCEKEMENVAGEYQSLQRKFDNLVGKSMALVKKLTERTQLQPLQRVINQQFQH